MDYLSLKNKILNITYNTSICKRKDFSIIDNTLLSLIGSTRTYRLGSKPDMNNIDILKKNISYSYENNTALSITISWGARKSSHFPYSRADLIDLCSFIQLNALGKNVISKYPFGVKYRVIINDSYWEYLYGSDIGINEYSNSINDLCSHFSSDLVQFEFEKLSSNLLNYPKFNTTTEKNYNILSQYWNDSKKIKNESDWLKLSSYESLKKNGWIGTIPNVMREFYIKRIYKSHPDWEIKLIENSVIKYLSYGMTINVFDIYERNNIDKCTVDFCLLRIPPPGLPHGLRGNRIRIRSIPYSISSITGPPWTMGCKYNYKTDKIEISDCSGELFYKFVDDDLVIYSTT